MKMNTSSTINQQSPAARVTKIQQREHKEPEILSLDIRSCRMCLEFDKELVMYSVFGSLRNDLSIPKIVSDIFLFEIEETDFLKNICEKCLGKIDISYGIFKEFTAADKRFKNLKIKENQLKTIESRVTKRKLIEHGPTFCPDNFSFKRKYTEVDQAKIPNPKQRKLEDPIPQFMSPERANKDKNRFENIIEIEVLKPLDNHEQTESDSIACSICGSDCRELTSKTCLDCDLIIKEEVELYGLGILKEKLPALKSQKRCDVGDFIQTCYICKTNVQRKNRHKHFANHFDVNKVCKECNSKAFKSFDAFNTHLGLHDTKREHKCAHCFRRFKSELSKLEHEITHDGKASPVEVAAFKKKAKVKTQETVTQKYPCQFCGKLYAKESYCRKHEKLHSEEKKFKCTDCDSSYFKEWELRKHIAIHQGKKNFVCDICGSSFHLRFTMVEHRRIHTGYKPYKCSYCKISFRTLQWFKKHRTAQGCAEPRERVQKGAGMRRETYSCSICCKEIGVALLYKRHMNKCHPEIKDLYKCEYCLYNFERPYDLKLHRQFRKNGVCRDETRKNLRGSFKAKELKCDLCSAEMLGFKNLYAHHEKMHCGEKAFVCDVKECGKTFQLAFYKRIHMKSHNQIKNYACEYCDARFVQRGHMTVHVRVHHTKLKPLKCPNCPKSFADPGCLSRHKRKCQI